MTAGPTNLGGLFVTVNLDVSRALRQLDQLQAKFTQTLRSASTGTNAAATAATTAAAAAGVKAISNNTKELTNQKNAVGEFTQELARMGAILLPGRAGTATYGMSALARSAGAMGVAVGASTAAMAAALTVAVALGFAIYQVGSAVARLTSLGVDAAKDLERLTVSMEVLLGGPRQARQEIGWLVEIAKISPFLTDTIINMDKLLISQGLVAGGLRGDLIAAVLDMAAALGLANENVDSIAYALSQVQARTYLSGDELRQLANQFIPVWNILRTLPEFADKSQAELRKLSEQGMITAEQFFTAFVAYGQRFEEASEKQANTVLGLLDKIQDIVRFELGQAMLDVERTGTGPLEAIRNVLQAIVGTLNQIDFRPFAASIGNLFQSVLGPITEGFTRFRGAIVTVFEVILPRIIDVIATVVRILINTFKTVFRAFDVFTTSGRDAMTIVATAFVIGFGVIIAAINASIGILRIFIGVLQFAIYAVAALFQAIIGLFTGDFSGAVSTFQKGVESLKVSLGGLEQLLTAPALGIKAAREALDSIRGMNIPKFSDDLNAVGDSLANVLDPSPPGGGAGTGGGGGGSRAVDQVNKVMDQLFDLTQRWFGLRSELEKGLLGEKGFEASISSIAGMGQRLIEALRSIGQSGVARVVEQSTLALLNLARRREEVAERLKEAEQKLADAVQGRDQMVAALRKGAIDFANALRLETETITRFEMVSERGFFIQSEETRQRSFVQTLQERVRALRQFLTNMRLLRDQGLDASFLQQLLMAGPEQAGEIAQGLVDGGQEMINEVNTLQNAVQQVADELGDFGADAFHNSGIEQMQGLVDGLTGELAAIEEAAQGLAEVVFQAVLPFAKEMEEAAAAGGKGVADGLAGSIPAVSAAMGGISGAVGGGMGNMQKFMEGNIEGITGLFERGTFDWLIKLEKWADDSIRTVEGWIDSLERLFSLDWRTIWNGLLRFLGEWWANLDDFLYDVLVNLGLWLIDIWDGIVKWWNNTFLPWLRELPGKIARGIWNGLVAVKDWLIEKITQWVKDILPGPLEKILGIQSPSRLMREYGMNVGQGLALGIEDSFGIVSAASERLAELATGAGAFGDFGAAGTSFAAHLDAAVRGIDGVAPNTEVRVFIGDTELKDIVKTEVIHHDNESAAALIMGSRIR